MQKICKIKPIYLNLLMIKSRFVPKKLNILKQFFFNFILF